MKAREREIQGPRRTTEGALVDERRPYKAPNREALREKSRSLIKKQSHLTPRG